MSIIKGNVEVDYPESENDAVNLGYLEDKLDEIKAMIASLVVEIREKNNITKVSQLENDMAFVTQRDLKEITKDQLRTFINVIK